MIETVIISSILGREVASQAITETSKKILNGILGIMDTSHFILIDLLEELDIQHTINIINSIIKDIENKPNNNTIDICLNHLNEIVKKILDEIEIIKIEITKYEQLWFKSIRTPNYNKLIVKLKSHTKIINNRLNLLINLLKIYM